MSKPYQKPALEEVQTPQVDSVAVENVDTDIKIGGAPTERVEMSLSVIYKKKLNLFCDFLKGDYASNNLEERAEAQLDFISSISDMLEADYPVMEECMNELISLIHKNPVPFSYENVLAPYWGMKNKPNGEKAKPYIQFIGFITGLAANIRRKPAYIKGIDVPTFLSFWNDKQKQNLNRYIYD